MTCSSSPLVAGPTLTLYRGARGKRRWRAWLSPGVPLRLRVNHVRLLVTISRDVGADADIVARLDSSDATQIEIDAEPNDSFFTTHFAPSLFTDLPESEYNYVLWAYADDGDGDPYPLTLTSKLEVVELIGPVSLE